MTGGPLRIDSPDFRRKLSRDTLPKSISMICGFLEKSLHHRIRPKWSLEIPAASKLIVGGPRAP